jgi:hypothetical protein
MRPVFASWRAYRRMCKHLPLREMDTQFKKRWDIADQWVTVLQCDSPRAIFSLQRGGP